ncbi:TlpA family protein disulfide reductase [Salinimicrobium sp. CAU 1759]
MNRIDSNITRHALPALLLLCLLFLLAACGSADEDSVPYAYLGGQIVNPTTDHVVVKRNGRVLDTVFLDSQNRFSYKVEDVQKGIYVMQHTPEIQNIYLSPGDSLLLRVNTVAFDESLHFSGTGDKYNNFLAEMFLQDEENSQLLLSFHEYTPENFLRKADSIKSLRLDFLNNTSKKRKFSEDFVCLAEDIIEYENNDLKERYSYLVNKYYKEYSKQFPEDYYGYRTDIDFNSERMQCSPGYKRFIENYLINYSLSWCANSGLDESDCYNLNNVNNVTSRLRKAGELIQVPNLKRTIMEKIAVRGIVMAKSREDIIAILEELKAQDIPTEELDKIRQLGTIQLAYLPGTSLANVSLLNMKGQLVTIGDVVEKPTAIFLWSVFDEGHVEEHELIKQFKKKYPEVNFIGINVDLGEEPAWRVAVRQNSYDPGSEYQLGSTRIKKDYFRYFLDKILLINASAEVVVGDSYLTSPEFESHILGFLNQ